MNGSATPLLAVMGQENEVMPMNATGKASSFHTSHLAKKKVQEGELTRNMWIARNISGHPKLLRKQMGHRVSRIPNQAENNSISCGHVTPCDTTSGIVHCIAKMHFQPIIKMASANGTCTRPKGGSCQCLQGQASSSRYFVPGWYCPDSVHTSSPCHAPPTHPTSCMGPMPDAGQSLVRPLHNFPDELPRLQCNGAPGETIS